ncbi:MAG: glycerol-3-phosphate dehydrogenase/oxidase [Proteobacteria bacterium]|nr:glycerol-3-phosphate dehydrogenase/oxidase [Pseudomonadota bacterium]
MKRFSVLDRKSYLEKLKSETFDLLIIGGGITGAGAARDAAMRGMKVALIEADDFASGTSSRSSKLVHGGIRYLENYEFKLVFEALSERTKLFEMAPHLVHPLRFMIPLFKGGRVGMGLMGLGMWLYDALSLFQAPELHERLNPKESIKRQPLLQSENLLGSYVYSDAYMDDDRLVFETLRSANNFGAVQVNFVKATGAQFGKDGKIQSVQVEDQLNHQRFSIHARHVISSVGPWTDLLGADLLHRWKKILRPTKGVHLTFHQERLPLSSAVVMAAESRIVFGIPRHEMVIVGTTDTDFQGDPSTVNTTEEDVTYLLGVLKRYFPKAAIKKEDILASYSGVRPLVHDGSDNEGKTSREHVIFSEPEGITFVAGGKYTTYRLMAQQVVEKALQFFSIEERAQWQRAATASPLNPLVTVETFADSTHLVEDLCSQTRLSAAEARLLVDRHGLEAHHLVKEYGHDLSYWEFEAAHAIHSTMCLHVEDFYRRRVPLFLATKDHGLSQFNEVCRVFAENLPQIFKSESEEKSRIQKAIESEMKWQSRQL